MIGYIVAGICGWLLRGVLEKVMTNIAIRIITSAAGKEKVFEMLAKGAQKMGGDRQRTCQNSQPDACTEAKRH